MSTDCTKWLKLRSGSEIRGTDAQLTNEAVEKIGYAFACRLADHLGTTSDRLKIAVGRDARASGPRIRHALIRGFAAADSDILDCGLCAAPALHSAAAQGPHPADATVMVTADRRKEQINGLRFVASCNFGEDELDDVLRLAAAVEVPERLVERVDAVEAYCASLRRIAAGFLQDDALKPLLGMHVIVDAGGGTGGFFAAFLESLGAETEGSCRLDPNPMPEALPASLEDPRAIASVQQLVLKHRADMGVLLDADCSRAAMVDQDGRILSGSRLIALLSALLLKDKPGATIVTDSVTSAGLTEFINEWGGIHYRFKRGYRRVIDEAIRLNSEGIDCPLAIETSGHTAFRENGFIDDGIYLATRLICEAFDLKREGKTLNTLLDGFREPVESIEIRLPVLGSDDPSAASQEIVEMVLSHTLENPEWQMAPDSREGVRINFSLDGGVKNAWFQLRMSVHDPVMALNAESDVPDGIRRVLTQLYGLIRGSEQLDLTELRHAIEA